MKTEIKLEKEIITFDNNFATLLYVSNYHYRYKVLYKADPIKSLKEKTYLVNIKVQTKPFTPKSNDIFANKNSNPNLILKNIINHIPSSKDIIRGNNKGINFIYKSDITSKFPNDKIVSLTKSTNSSKIIIKSIRDFIPVTIQNLKDKNFVSPILDYSQTKENLAQSDIEFKVKADELLLNEGHDPAALAEKQNLISSTEKTFGGIITNNKLSGYRIENKSLNETFLAKSYINTPNKRNSQDFSTELNKIVTVPTKLNIGYILAEEYIDIPKNLVGNDDFYFIFELVNGNNIVVQRESKLVNHSKNFIAISVPKLSPTVMASNANIPGKNIIEVKQNDPNALGIKVYRKIINTTLQNNDSEYTFVVKLPLLKNESSRRIEDRINNANQIIYRAIPYGIDDIVSAEFGSAVAKAVNINTESAPFRKRKTFVSLYYEILESGILIKISSVPTSVSSVQLRRKNLSNKTDFQFIGKPQLTNNKSLNSISILDNQVSKGRIYEYDCLLIYKDGASVTSTNNLIIEYLPETSNIVQTEIVNPRAVEKGSQMDILFDLETNFITKSEDQLRQALENQGIISYFQDSINKEKLQNLIAYNILRQNITTGEIEDFGIIVDKSFTDSFYAQPAGIKPLQTGCEYLYTVATYFRNPFTTLEGYEKRITYKNSPSKNYSYKPYYWNHPVTLTEGNIINNSTLLQRYSKTQFGFGEIGNIVRLTMSLTKILPTIHDGIVTNINSKINKIQWKVQGAVTKIDHFVIILEILGNRTIIGKSHNISNTNYFEYYDELTNGEKGGFTYIIVPILYDYSKGIELKTNTIVVK